MTQVAEQLRQRLETLYDRQEADEWPPAVAKKIRAEIDRLEKQLRDLGR